MSVRRVLLALVRLVDRKLGESEIILEFDRVRYEIVRSITRHTLFEIPLCQHKVRQGTTVERA